MTSETDVARNKPCKELIGWRFLSCLKMTKKESALDRKRDGCHVQNEQVKSRHSIVSRRRDSHGYPPSGAARQRLSISLVSSICCLLMTSAVVLRLDGLQRHPRRTASLVSQVVFEMGSSKF